MTTETVVAGRTAPRRPVGPGEFRQALAQHAGGVAVVTGPGPVGLTVTSLASASIDPPLVSIYVGRSSATWAGLRHAPVFGVNMLACDQAELATRFADQNADRFAAPTRWRFGPLGIPVLDGGVAQLMCERYRAMAIGDHWLLVGLVVAAEIREAGAPLVYHRSRFGQFQLAAKPSAAGSNPASGGRC